MANSTRSRPTTANNKLPEAPPQSFDELRALLVEITRGKSKVTLGAKARDAFGQILDLQGSSDLLSITSLSEKIGTNPSTITRLARNLGYDNFAAFQKALFASPASQPGAFYLKQAESALSSGDQPVKQLAAQLCHENQANIDRFIETFDTDSFWKAVTLIAEAPRISVYGIRQFHSLAAFLAYGLRLIRTDVSVLDANALGVAEEIAAMRRGEVCVVASVSPYSSDVVKVARVAAEEGIDVVAITDRASSPLVTHAKAALFAPHQSSFISNSITSYFAVAECLINAVAAATAEEAKAALTERQQLIERMKIEDS
ncbi:MAG: MurR/RpiR family transcriptional regulator [Proteobacteria bacterium]|nr:MurR/RpiR family transcriptional regulator [Pseudomonadota bacterium]